MAAKRNVGKKTAKPDKPEPVSDPKTPIDPTPAAMQETLAAVTKVVKLLSPPPEPRQSDLVYALLHGIFADGLPDGYGQEAVRRIESSFVDRNEFRVTEAFQAAELLQDLAIPELFARCTAARDAVAQLYNDQNSVTLEFLREAAVTDRNQFFTRVPSIPASAARFLVQLMSFEECIFSPRSTVRVQMRLGFDPKSGAVEKFFAELKQVLAPFGHLPLQVGPDRPNGAVITDPPLSPAGLVLRLSGKKR